MKAPFQPERVLVTGGAGFIGSALVRHVLGEPVEKVIVLDALTYAGHRQNLDKHPRLVFREGNVCDRDLVETLLREHAIDTVFHLAAESHVDRSIERADEFVRTNVLGTFALLEAARAAPPQRFIQVSTDEVYGALGETGRFTEASPYAPRSPYAASKAAADHFARAWLTTHEVPVIVTTSCNNYGPRQLPEKLVPVIVRNALQGRTLPLYGDGRQCREWLHVEDHVRGLWLAATHGTVGETYAFGSSEERSNRAMVEQLADIVDELTSRPPGTSRALVRSVADRKGHDFRYAIDASKARTYLHWTPSIALSDGLRRTVCWYLDNAAWCDAVMP